MFPASKPQQYIIVHRVPGNSITIQASIEMTAAKADSLLPAFGMKPIRPRRFWFGWRSKIVFLDWDELKENGNPIQNPRLVWFSFSRLQQASWTIECEEFIRYYWWIFN